MAKHGITKPATQKEINVATKGLENIIPNVGQKEKEIDIEFGQQTVTGIRDRTLSAQKAIEHILEGDLNSEEDIKALEVKNTTVFSRTDDRKGQGGVLVHNSQPEDVKLDDNESITSPKAEVEEVKGTIQEYSDALGLKTGKNFLGQKGVVNSKGRVLPFATRIGEARELTVEQFEKLLGEKLLIDEPSGAGTKVTGKSIASL